MSRAERKQRAIQSLERVGLGSRIGHRPGELSGGQQQRVAVARALVGDPALLLADEPTGNLDSVSTADVLALIDELHAAGRTIIVITHEAEVADRAERIVHVRDGLVYDGAGVLASGHSREGLETLAVTAEAVRGSTGSARCSPCSAS